MNKLYKNKFIFAMQYYNENNGSPFVHIPKNYFVTKQDAAYKKSASKWIPRLLNQQFVDCEMGDVK